jgi:hypothetical protein
MKRSDNARIYNVPVRVSLVKERFVGQTHLVDHETVEFSTVVQRTQELHKIWGAQLLRCN